MATKKTVSNAPASIVVPAEEVPTTVTREPSGEFLNAPAVPLGPMIYSCMEDCMRRIGAISKDARMNAQSKGTSLNYTYRSVDAVYNALQPAMIESGVTVVPQVLDLQFIPKSEGIYQNTAIVKMAFRWTAADGSFAETVVYNEGQDSGDKAISKAMANAFKYAAFITFVIPTEEMDTYDPDHYRPEIEEEAVKGDKKAKVESSLSDKVEKAVKPATPPKEQFDRRSCINLAASKVGYPKGLLTEEEKLEFGCMVQEAIKQGKAVNKKTGEMSPDELQTCMRAVVELFGKVS